MVLTVQERRRAASPQELMTAAARLAAISQLGQNDRPNRIRATCSRHGVRPTHPERVSRSQTRGTAHDHLAPNARLRLGKE